MDANWQNVLLTDSGFYIDNVLSKPNAPLINRLREMVGKPFADTKVLFIPTASMQNEAKAKAICHRLRDELLAMDFQPCNITIHDVAKCHGAQTFYDIQVDSPRSEADVLQYDIMYITGGKTPYLAQCVREAGFDAHIRAFIAANKVYVGMSAGSLLLTPYFNQDNPNHSDFIECHGAHNSRDIRFIKCHRSHTSRDIRFAGLGILNAYVSVHCAPGTPHRTDLPLPHIALCENQAIAVSSDSYQVIGENCTGEIHPNTPQPIPPPIQFVQATPAQINQVTDLLCTLYEMPHDEVLEENERLFADKNQAFFLALDGILNGAEGMRPASFDKAVGVAHASLRHEYVNGTDDGIKGYLEGIFVLPEYRKRGIADGLVRFAEHWMAQHGCRQIASDCTIENTDRYQFHLKLGFEETERCIFFVKPIAPLDYTICKIDPTLRKQVQPLLDESWGGPLIAANGKLHDTRTSPGYAAVCDGEALGYLLYDLQNDECEILVLESTAPNIGIATALIERVKQTAIASNIRQITVRTTNDNTHALRFYQRRGFALRGVCINAMEAHRALKHSLPLIGMDGIPLRDEITLALDWRQK
ncbi:MAG: GNAT family N-acetyltransferase [Defluviitaleaceae bacterium]|nr:GNAT family N-acetyltransferase [Defluviitaleaceae bacterium]